MRYNSDIVFLSITRRCNSECSFCRSNSGPDRSEVMPLSDVLRYVDAVNNLPRGQVAGLGFTGGEPLLELDSVVEAIKRSQVKCKILSNGFWGRTPEQAKLTVKKLVSTGKHPEISISTDSEHKKHIPIEYIKNAIEAVVNTSSPCVVAVSYGDEREYESIKRDLLDYFSPKLGSKIDQRLRFRPREISPHGRGIKYMFEEKPISEFFYGFNGCYQPTITENGMVQVCACDTDAHLPNSPMCLGNAKDEDLATILKRSASLTSILRHSNTFRIFVDFLREQHLDDRLKPTYPHRCALCHDIFNNPELSNSVMENINSLVRATEQAPVFDVVVDLLNKKRLLLKVRRCVRGKSWKQASLKQKLNDCVINVKFGDDLDIDKKVLPMSLLTTNSIHKVLMLAECS